MKTEEEIKQRINFLIKLANDELDRGNTVVEHMLRSKAHILEWVLEEE